MKVCIKLWGVAQSEALVTLKGRPNKAMTDLLTTVSKSRLMDSIGKLSKMDIEKVEDATMLQFGLSLPILVLQR